MRAQVLDLAEFAAAAGASIITITRQEGWRLLQAWRGIYCAPVQEATGKWVSADGCAWHTFGNGFFPSVRGRHAFNEYKKQQSNGLLVLPENDHYSALQCTSEAPVDFSALKHDVYVAPSTFEWTMVFTHEHPDCGPYFARADWREGRTRSL